MKRLLLSIALLATVIGTVNLINYLMDVPEHPIPDSGSMTQSGSHKATTHTINPDQPADSIYNTTK